MKIYYNNRLKEFARKNRNNPTLSEKILWRFLKGKQMKGYDFHRQKPIGNYIADFYCYKLQLVIELDGFTHTFERVQKKDIIKQEYIEDLNFTVLRFKDEEVINDVGAVLARIEDFIDEFKQQNCVTHPSGSPLSRGEDEVRERTASI